MGGQYGGQDLRPMYRHDRWTQGAVPWVDNMEDKM